MAPVGNFAGELFCSGTTSFCFEQNTPEISSVWFCYSRAETNKTSFVDGKYLDISDPLVEDKSDIVTNPIIVENKYEGRPDVLANERKGLLHDVDRILRHDGAGAPSALPSYPPYFPLP